MGRANAGGKWIRLGLAACGLALGCDTAAPTPLPDSSTPPSDASAVRAAHVLSRTGYGPDAWSQARIEQLGVEGYIDEQLSPASIDDRAYEAMRAQLPSLGLELHDLIDGYGGPGGMPFQPILELMQAKLLASVYSRRQLEQVLTDFWFDHFNVYGLDGFTNFALIPYERDTIRPHVLGRFEDLLLAVARDPAMLYYLDNYLSSREGFEFDGEIRGLNENYARELLELHTVGVDGGYDQADVIAVARAFTGWTIGSRDIAGADGSFFWGAAHDQDAKSIMGELEIPAFGGEQDGRDVLAYLAQHPSTAGFLCGRLIERFVDEDAPASLVDRCSSTYLSSRGDLRQVMRVLLLSEEFLDTARAGSKVKRPLVFAGSLARGCELDLSDEQLLLGLVFYLELLGEPLYQAHPPTGYPDASAHWASGGSLVTRFNLITLLTNADLALGIDWGVSNGSPAEVVDGVARKLLPGGLSSATRDQAIALVSQLPPAPAAPRVREAAALILSSPDYMRH